MARQNPLGLLDTDVPPIQLHTHTCRGANRVDCSQACRTPNQVANSQGRSVAHGKHLPSKKDHDPSANMAGQKRSWTSASSSASHGFVPA